VISFNFVVCQPPGLVCLDVFWSDRRHEHLTEVRREAGHAGFDTFPGAGLGRMVKFDLGQEQLRRVTECYLFQPAESPFPFRYRLPVLRLHHPRFWFVSSRIRQTCGLGDLQSVYLESVVPLSVRFS
jgi:hypothetical protein